MGKLFFEQKPWEEPNMLTSPLPEPVRGRCYGCFEVGPISLTWPVGNAWQLSVSPQSVFKIALSVPRVEHSCPEPPEGARPAVRLRGLEGVSLQPQLSSGRRRRQALSGSLLSWVHGLLTRTCCIRRGSRLVDPISCPAFWSICSSPSLLLPLPRLPSSLPWLLPLLPHWPTVPTLIVP